MTNAEKYLTVSTKEFKNAIINTQGDIGGLYSLEKWLDTEVKPTLTEDERVILRNLDSYTEIGRTEKDVAGYTDVYIKDKNACESLFMFKSNLFQFIKERRRIRDKGAFRWLTLNFI